MTTDDMILRLAADVRPVNPHAGVWRMAGALLAGGFVSLLAIDLVLGAPLRVVEQIGVMAFAVKFSYAVAMTAIAVSLLVTAGRPGQRLGIRLAWLLAPPIVVLAAAAMEFSQTAPSARESLVIGTTSSQCLAAIVLLSMPVFAALVWAFRWFAPTRLALTGFLAGLASGGMASVIYALYCPETAASFMLLWYTLAMTGAGLMGAAAGSRLMRW